MCDTVILRCLNVLGRQETNISYILVLNAVIPRHQFSAVGGVIYYLFGWDTNIIYDLPFISLCSNLSHYP